MIKQNKSKLTLLIAGILFGGFIIAGCNNSGDADKAAKDTAAATVAPAATEAKHDTAPPATGDTSKLKGSEKPTPEKP